MRRHEGACTTTHDTNKNPALCDPTDFANAWAGDSFGERAYSRVHDGLQFPTHMAPSVRYAVVGSSADAASPPPRVWHGRLLRMFVALIAVIGAYVAFVLVREGNAFDGVRESERKLLWPRVPRVYRSRCPASHVVLYYVYLTCACVGPVQLFVRFLRADAVRPICFIPSLCFPAAPLPFVPSWVSNYKFCIYVTCIWCFLCPFRSSPVDSSFRLQCFMRVHQLP